MEKYFVKLGDLMKNEEGITTQEEVDLYGPMFDETEHNYSSIVSIDEILQRCGFEAALQALQHLPVEQKENVRQLIVELLEPVCIYTSDERPQYALRVAQDFALGKAAKEDLIAARTTCSHLFHQSRRQSKRTDEDIALVVMSALVDNPRIAVYHAAKEAAKILSKGKFGEIAQTYQDRVFRSWLGQP